MPRYSQRSKDRLATCDRRMQEIMNEVIKHFDVTIVHGWRDEIIPWQNSVRYGEACHARLVLLDSDHRLTDVLDEVGHHFSLFLDLMSELA